MPVHPRTPRSRRTPLMSPDIPGSGRPTPRDLDPSDHAPQAGESQSDHAAAETRRPVTLYGIDDATLGALDLALDVNYQRVVTALAEGRDPAGVYEQPMGPLTELQEELRS